jgi:hypothetical protein
LAGKLQTPAEAVKALVGRIDETRRKAGELRTRRAELEAAPCDRAATAPKVAELVRTAAARAAPDVGALVGHDPGAAHELLAWLRQIGASGRVDEPSAFDLLCALVPKQVTAWLTAATDEEYADAPEPLTAEQRRVQLAAVGKEIAALEAAEIAGLWEMESCGLAAPWNGRENPRLVLGLG